MSEYNRISSVWRSVAMALGVTIGSSLGYISGNLIENLVGNKIPNTKQVQQEHVAPNKLEIKCKDLDGNDELGTIMNVGNKSYLLREVNGMPVLSAYKIKPAEIKYKK